MSDFFSEPGWAIADPESLANYCFTVGNARNFNWKNVEITVFRRKATIRGIFELHFVTFLVRVDWMSTPSTAPSSGKEILERKLAAHASLPRFLIENQTVPSPGQGVSEILEFYFRKNWRKVTVSSLTPLPLPLQACLHLIFSLADPQIGRLRSQCAN
jgi:hypothetical protein